MSESVDRVCTCCGALWDLSRSSCEHCANNSHRPADARPDPDIKRWDVNVPHITKEDLLGMGNTDHWRRIMIENFESLEHPVQWPPYFRPIVLIPPFKVLGFTIGAQIDRLSIYHLFIPILLASLSGAWLPIVFYTGHEVADGLGSKSEQGFDLVDWGLAIIGGVLGQRLGAWAGMPQDKVVEFIINIGNYLWPF
jgi:hypothetical protein